MLSMFYKHDDHKMYELINDSKKLAWINLYLDIAQLYAKQSHCVSKKVCALIVSENRIISTGINGTPSGSINCDEYFKNKKDIKEHHEWSINNEIHAEANAIAFAAKNGVNTKGASMFITLSPCIDCAKLIIASGITTVYFDEMYDKGNSDKAITLLVDNYINVVQYTNRK